MRKLTALLMGLMLAPQVFALGGGYSLERGLFRNADIDRSETITLEEAKRLSHYDLSDPEVFAKADKGGEGYVDFTEFREYLRLTTRVRHD
jgi:hypothetical protein